MFTPRSDGVSMRWRCSLGRMSPTVCVAALVWPLAWQSKQATPWLALQAAAVVGGVELLLRERRDAAAAGLRAASGSGCP